MSGVEFQQKEQQRAAYLKLSKKFGVKIRLYIREHGLSQLSFWWVVAIGEILSYWLVSL